MTIRKRMVSVLLVSLAKLESSAHALIAADPSMSPYPIYNIRWLRLKKIQARKVLRSFLILTISRSEYLFKGHPSGEDVNRGGIYDLHATLLQADFHLLFKGKVW